MAESRNWQRIRERLELKLPVRVRCREAAELEWTEITRLIDVTPFGAGFTLKRPVEKGRLLHMTIPMPRQLRVFDHVEDQYRVWALVRHVKQKTAAEGTLLFEVGVAFIGKNPPRSYFEDPSKRFEVGKTKPGELAKIQELAPAELPISDKRAHTRHNIPTDVLIETFSENGKVEESERTVTENISSKGAAIYTSLNLPIGRLIRLSSEQYKVSVYAAVRGSSMGPAGVPRIHVEFVDGEWPL
ncbi:MAG TPA: PilZ domain-containing protein [Pyrinomonadaceae bacterium]|nr:PilZ domain-containing protein [Pyrinomonadaceae bacterium]